MPRQSNKTTEKKEIKTKTKNVIEKENINISKPVKSYEDFENEINDLKSMIKELIVQNKSLKEETTSILKNEKENFQNYNDVEYVEIHPNKRIQVISLYDGKLVLSTGPKGTGKSFTFKNFGVMNNINYSDLVDILHYHKSFAEQGLFYICDKNVVSNNGLQNTYEVILNKETMDNLLNMDLLSIKNLFNNTTHEQKEIIVSLIVNKIHNKEYVDLNKVHELSKIYEKDIYELSNNVISI